MPNPEGRPFESPRVVVSNVEGRRPKARGRRLHATGARSVLVALVSVCCLLPAAFGLGVGSLRAQAPNFFTGFSKPDRPPSHIKPEELIDVTFRQRLNERLPLDIPFKDEYGRPVTLGKYFTGTRPVILAFVYYQCPMLCTQVMNGISASLRALPFTAGQDFDVVLVSFDPRDDPAAALEKKQKHLEYWKTEGQSGGWHLLTGAESSIAEVTRAAGFTYKWDSVTGQFAHVSGVLVATPDGTLSRYFYGVEFSPKELRLALVESGQGRVGKLIDELLLYCYHYDPETGRYGATVMNLVRLGGILTLGTMVTFFVMMRRREIGVLEGAQPR
jgi:protein SCO1/2